MIGVFKIPMPLVAAGNYEHKESVPLRYVGLRLLKAQGVLFADGIDRKYYAVLTNLDWDAIQRAMLKTGVMICRFASFLALLSALAGCHGSRRRDCIRAFSGP